MAEQKNKKPIRIKAARGVVAKLWKNTNQNGEWYNVTIILTDLLTDLRHYCEVRGLDFKYSVRWSQMHQEAEASDALP